LISIDSVACWGRSRVENEDEDDEDEGGFGRCWDAVLLYGGGRSYEPLASTVADGEAATAVADRERVCSGYAPNGGGGDAVDGWAGAGAGRSLRRVPTRREKTFSDNIAD
jgi:hypothetical protein